MNGGTMYQMNKEDLLDKFNFNDNSLETLLEKRYPGNIPTREEIEKFGRDFEDRLKETQENKK